MGTKLDQGRGKIVQQFASKRKFFESVVVVAKENYYESFVGIFFPLLKVPLAWG